MHAQDPSRTASRQVPGPAPAHRAPTSRPRQTAGGLAESVAHLQRSAGNAAVIRALAPATTVQRYAQGAEASGFDKVSDSGRIALRDRQTAYAHEDLIKNAAAALDGQDRVAITLEAGESVKVGDLTLHRVLPVYKSADRARKAVKEAGRSEGEAAYEPVRGDAPEQRAGKRDAYLEHLGSGTAISPVKPLIDEILQAKKKGDKALVNKLHGKAHSLANSVMGGGWLRRQLDRHTSLRQQTLEGAQELLTLMTSDYVQGLDSVREREGEASELAISVPNDCQGAAHQLIGRPPEGGLSKVREEPAVGENHYVDLRSQEGGAWQNHFAAVILRDGGDSLTYETAADSDAQTQWGKSLGYFALYGAAGTEQSFAHVIGEENQALGATQEHGE
ncbi:hypothetical protein [Streptomyces sp. NPDC087300]|uniref:hypothetical protein n=1 Tax=Streptomyces sp. NPDC087300 TaxID=3365780 RepID=UPI003814646F